MRVLKDRAIAKALALFVEYKLKGAGKIVQCTIDSTTKSIGLTLWLKGEKEPLDVRIGRYELTNKDGLSSVTLYDISTSRKWIDVVAKEYIEGKPFAIPPHIAKVLQLVV